MRQLEIGMQNHPHKFLIEQRAFSLLELLVVLFIIGIIITVAVLALGNLGKNQEIKSAGKLFSARLNLVEEQAILEPRVYGLVINNNGYGYYKIIKVDNRQQWQRIDDNRLLHFHSWPPGTEISLKISNQGILTIPGPRIIINTSGETTAFDLILHAGNFNYLIKTDGNGNILEKQL